MADIRYNPNGTLSEQSWEDVWKGNSPMPTTEIPPWLRNGRPRGVEPPPAAPETPPVAGGPQGAPAAEHNTPAPEAAGGPPGAPAANPNIATTETGMDWGEGTEKARPVENPEPRHAAPMDAESQPVSPEGREGTQAAQRGNTGGRAEEAPPASHAR